MTHQKISVSGLIKIVLVASSLLVDPIAGRGDLPLTHYRGSRIVSAWLPAWTDKNGAGIGWKTVENNYDLLDEVSFFAWNADAQTGALTAPWNMPAQTGALTPPASGMSEQSVKKQVIWLQTRDVTALFTVTVFGKVSDFLAVPAAQTALIDNIVKTDDHYGFSGVDIDFEQFGGYKDGDEESYAKFLDKLAKRIHQEKDINGFPKIAIATIIAHTRHEKSGYTDEAAIANTAIDRIRVMAYDDYWTKSEVAGAGAPLPWTKNVVKYIDSLSAPHEKFILGIPTYSYRWPVKSGNEKNTVAQGMSITYPEAQALMKTYRASRVWDNESDTPSFRYVQQPGGQNWIAYYEDAQSCDAKIANALLPSEMGGICEWALGFEDPASWSVISQTLATPYPIYGAIGQYYARYGAGSRFGAPLGPIEPFGAENETLPEDHEGIRQRFERGTIEYKWGDWQASFMENRSTSASAEKAEDNDG